MKQKRTTHNERGTEQGNANNLVPIESLVPSQLVLFLPLRPLSSLILPPLRLWVSLCWMTTLRV